MAVKDIVEKILGNAKSEVLSIETKSLEEAKKIFSQTTAEVEKQKRDLLAVAGEKAASIVEQKKIEAQLDSQKEIAAVKQEILKEAFSRAGDMFVSMESLAYLDFVAKRILSLVKTGREEIIFDENDRKKINQDFQNKICAEVSKKINTPCNLKFSFDSKNGIKGGFILIADKYRIDNSINALLEDIRDTVELEVANQLFGA